MPARGQENPEIPERLFVLLANGDRYEIRPTEGPDMLSLLLDPDQTWVRFSTVDGLTVHIDKRAIIGLENPVRGQNTDRPIGFVER